MATMHIYLFSTVTVSPWLENPGLKGICPNYTIFHLLALLGRLTATLSLCHGWPWGVVSRSFSSSVLPFVSFSPCSWFSSTTDALQWLGRSWTKPKQWKALEPRWVLVGEAGRSASEKMHNLLLPRVDSRFATRSALVVSFLKFLSVRHAFWWAEMVFLQFIRETIAAGKARTWQKFPPLFLDALVTLVLSYEA